MAPMEPLVDQVRRTAAEMQAALGGHPLATRCAEVVDRLEGPLRVAIAGRVKAGKSTLLNALLGEQLAPTDAGECTTIATWYRHGADYAVGAVAIINAHGYFLGAPIYWLRELGVIRV